MKRGGVMGTVRFLHTADLHLDSPFAGLSAAGELERLQQSTFQAFDRLIDYAVKEKPDFIVIAGDVYDGEDRSLRAQIRFQKGMQQLNEAGIPVYVSYGNHDHLAGSWTTVSLPPNVESFAENVEQKKLTVRGEDVYLYGFSYPSRHVREPMITHYPKASADGLHIGLLHGSAAGDSAHAVYAPFTLAELAEKNYHYWALGHIHKRQVLSHDPAVVYPGNLQGRHRNEQGVKGFYDVTLSKTSCELAFVRASSIVFTQLTVDCRGIEFADDWISLCERAADAAAAEYGSIIVELIMEHTEQLAQELRKSTQDEWLELLREQYAGIEPFVWISSVHWPHTESELPRALYEPIEQTLLQFTGQEWASLADELYGHRAGRYLEPLDEDAAGELAEQAAALLAEELLKEG